MRLNCANKQDIANTCSYRSPASSDWGTLRSDACRADPGAATAKVDRAKLGTISFGTVTRDGHEITVVNGSFDMVDGNYMLDLSNATDQTVDRLLPTLIRLPTGFTFIGPGEDRDFWLTLNNATISDGGLDSLCNLHLGAITLENCHNLSDASAGRLSKLTFTFVSIGEGVPFSDDATRRLQSSLGSGCVVLKRTD